MVSQWKEREMNLRDDGRSLLIHWHDIKYTPSSKVWQSTNYTGFAMLKRFK
jgi:hypothetical protein